MKKIITLVAILLTTLSMYAQSPDKMSYQAVIRDAASELLTNQMVGVKISILQTTTTGTAVYEESQNKNTNTNGLLTLEIGAGTVISGDMATIDWSNDDFFIKTEIDPTGGTNYSIVGTSQILSVPYSFLSKTAINVVNDMVDDADNDPTNEYNTGVVLNGTNLEITDTGGTQTADLSPLQDGVDDADNDPTNELQALSEVLVQGNDAGAAQLKNVSDPTDVQDATTKAYVDDLISALEARIEALEPAEIGDFRDGGVVFWLDPADPYHGLVCAIEDQSSNKRWYNGSFITTTATGTAIGTGKANTILIIAFQGPEETDYAAGLAASYTGGGYTDWFLPSREELKRMRANRVVINTTAMANGGSSFSNGRYWSSTESTTNTAWRLDFLNNVGFSNNKDHTYDVRAVRSF